MWKVASDVSGRGYSLHIQDPQGRVIASVGSHDMRVAGVSDQFLVIDHEEIKRIAAQIAATPALLEALEAILSDPTSIHIPGPLKRQARAAVAGARGGAGER